ncbi:chorismate mutase [Enterobacteriaceae endosymbiont of Donacia semicuprea]|uniref:chorismate mutase n=1 Tax=Enterobacteriaceae endosymbiont of Donacia semicuprea TaxID=2675783 RepID=UPI001449CEB3|nr:chorismate mutase [Enterobacteriaceae endosymbiont of Donacia semicuprea]QJC33028.1 hypothetical protein GJT91_01900 [Enterobacteriaceae endosymbiont of Donacia semicuprea]
MLKKLIILRDKIDILDKKLLEIINKRLILVKKIGVIKNNHELPIYDPEREKYIIKIKRKEAKKKGISPDLIEKILYCIINESYLHEQKQNFKKLNSNISNILIISNNKMGHFFKKMLIMSNYNIIIIELENFEVYNNISNLFLNICMVIISIDISIPYFDILIYKLKKLPKNCIIIIISSIENILIKKISKIHKGPILGLYPLFDLKNTILIKKSILCCFIHKSKSYIWFLKQMEIWGLKIKNINIIKYDQFFFLKSLQYFSTLIIYNIFLLKKNEKLEKQLSLLSIPFYDLNLFPLKKNFLKDLKSYINTILFSSNNKKNIRKYLNHMNNIINLIQKKKIKKIINIFKNN